MAALSPCSHSSIYVVAHLGEARGATAPPAGHRKEPADQGVLGLAERLGQTCVSSESGPEAEV